MKQMDIRLYFGVFLKFIEIFVLLDAEYIARSRICLHFPILTCVMFRLISFTNFKAQFLYSLTICNNNVTIGTPVESRLLCSTAVYRE